MDDFLKRNREKHEKFSLKQSDVYITERLYFKMKGGVNRVREGVAIDKVFDGGQKYYEYAKKVVEEADACILGGGSMTVSLQIGE